MAIKPKPAFKPLLEIALTRDNSNVVLVQDNTCQKGKASTSTDDATKAESGLWWRRGRVELYREHGMEVLLAA